MFEPAGSTLWYLVRSFAFVISKWDQFVGTCFQMIIIGLAKCENT